MGPLHFPTNAGTRPQPFTFTVVGNNALSGFATANDGENVAGVVGTNEGGDGGIGVAGGINFPIPPLFLEHIAFGYLGVCRSYGKHL